LHRESKALGQIHEYLSLQIPNPIYQSFDSQVVGEVFVGYKKIHGKSLLKNDFNRIHNKEHLAMQLGTFLKELHNVPIDKLKDVELDRVNNYQFFKIMYKEIQENLLKHMKASSIKRIHENFISYLNNSKNQNYTDCIIHTDFGPTNILYNDDLISGIIDFSDICIGDPALDIACLMGKFGYGEDFVRQIIPVYNEVEHYIERAKFFISTFPLQDALFGFKNNNKDVFNFGMEDYI